MESPRSGRDKSRREELLRTWLVKFSANHQAQGREPAVTEETLPIFLSLWAEGFADVPDEQLEQAFILTLQTCKFFPTVADIRGQLDTKRKALAENEVEDVWQRILEYVNEWCHPDGITTFGAVRPVLTSKEDHALRAAGGSGHLWGCPTDKRVWAKKAFVEDYMRQDEVFKAENVLGPGEILRRLTGALPTLPPANPDWEKKYPPPAGPQNLPKLAVVKTPPEPFPVLTEEEWERRKQEQRDKVCEWVATHPEIESK